MAVRFLLWLFLVYHCVAYPTFKRITASSGTALPEWEKIASSPNGKYRADIGIGYQANNSGIWECKLAVENVISQNIETNYACGMAEGYDQDFCSLVVLDGPVMLLSNQDKALVSSLTDYQASNSQYLVFKLDNYGNIYFDFSISQPPPSTSTSSSKSSGSTFSLRNIGIVAAAVVLIIAAFVILRTCYKNYRMHSCECESCDHCEEKKKKKKEEEEKEKEKEKKCCCECKCKECEVKELQIVYCYNCPNTYRYCKCGYY